MSHKAAFERDENKMLLAINARTLIRNIGIGGVVWGILNLFIGAAAKQDGKLSAEQLLELEKAGCPTCGSCSGMFTANSMNCLCEALGLALPLNGTLLATSAERRRLYRRAAERIIAATRLWGGTSFVTTAPAATSKIGFMPSISASGRPDTVSR